MKTKNINLSLFPNLSDKDFQLIELPKSAKQSVNLAKTEQTSDITYNKCHRQGNGIADLFGISYLIAFIAYMLAHLL